ncbi:hypothetical protein TWF569_007100 [Orbilia oligospora]|nr:hypothetical protein TWF706_005623 [Orbilia oligospora]KAF3121085.1 hypothetical protein TWF594_003432 [Orbilia oligospora]KAF3144424.1 hypothetical protein TWF569_007100 [Orbilia oligospora]
MKFLPPWETMAMSCKDGPEHHPFPFSSLLGLHLEHLLLPFARLFSNRLTPRQCTRALRGKAQLREKGTAPFPRAKPNASSLLSSLTRFIVKSRSAWSPPIFLIIIIRTRRTDLPDSPKPIDVSV